MQRWDFFHACISLLSHEEHLVHWNIGTKWKEKYLCSNNCSMITTICHSIPKITSIAYIVRVGFFHMSGITVSWEYSIRNFVSKDDILIEWQQRYAVIYNVRKIQNEVIQAWLSLLGLFIRFHPFFPHLTSSWYWFPFFVPAQNIRNLQFFQIFLFDKM